MTSDHALALILQAIQVVLWAAGPVLLCCLVAGLLVGVLQTVLQLNEASVSFIVKAAVMIAVLLTLGPAITAKLVDYTKASLEAIEHVVQ
jgi:flagellar biosynthetic protein FliQ